MNPKVKSYFDRELSMLADYEKEYGSKHPIINFHMDKIRWALQLAKYLELLHVSEIDEFISRLYQSEGGSK